MKAPISWIREFVDITSSTQELSDAFTLAGLEVEKIEEEKGETIFDIALTPNLGHCLSIIGLAREISALFSIPVKEKKSSPIAEKRSTAEQIDCSLEDTVNCPRYCCCLIESVRIAPSPSWLQEKLLACGIRPINNVVDATNYVMLELGQPLHAFDAQKIAGKKILITSSSPYKKLTTLDGKEREISENTLLICDEEKPLALAGIMGGEESSVSDTTHTILLEAALFTPTAVRRSSKQFFLRTESSQRFERGIDSEGVAIALDRAAELIQKIAGGKVLQKIDLYPNPAQPKPILCRQERVNAFLGTGLSLNEIGSLFKRLNIQIVQEDSSSLQLIPPSYRNDLQSEIDLIEEIARLYGYNNIPLSDRRFAPSTLPHSPIYLFENHVKEFFLTRGMQEWLTCNLISQELAKLSSRHKEALVSVLHPVSADQSILRPSLLPGMLLSTKQNLDRQISSLCSFEVGRIYWKEKDSYKEELSAAILLTGHSAPYYWDPKPRDFDFFDLKGIVEELFTTLRLPTFTLEASHLPIFHPKREARIKLEGKTVGVIGELHPYHLKPYGFDFNQRILFAELDLNTLFLAKKEPIAFTPLSTFPSSSRDWTITVPDALPVEQLLLAIESCRSPLLEKILLLDLYKSEQIGKDRKNITFRLTFRDHEKTIAFEKVEEEFAKIVSKSVEKLQL